MNVERPSRPTAPAGATGEQPRSTRAAALGLLASGGLAGLAGALTADLVGTLPDGPVQVVPVMEGVRILAQGLGALLAVALAGLAAAGAVVALSGSAGAARRHAPPWAVRSAGVLVLLAAGSPAALAVPGPASPAVGVEDPSATTDVPVPSWDLPREVAPAEPGWRPTAPPAPPRHDPPAELVTRGHAPPEEVVVTGGDTLWGIAARHLGPAATAEDVAAEWPRWYAANRERIGPDPDLILPGQRLVPPAGDVAEDGS